MNEISKPAWSYDDSVERVRPMVLRWKAITAELLRELYEARQQLSKQGVRRDLDANASKLKTWNDYCVDVGLNRSTVNRWLKRFDVSTNKIQEKPKRLAAPSQPEPPKPLEYDIEATHQIGKALHKRATFRLLVMRLLLHALAYIWRTMPRETTVMLRLSAPKAPT